MISRDEAVAGALLLLHHVHKGWKGRGPPPALFHMAEHGKLKLLQQGGRFDVESMKRIQSSAPGSYVLFILRGRTCMDEEEYNKVESVEQLEDRVTCIGVGEESFGLTCLVRPAGGLGSPQFMDLPDLGVVELLNTDPEFE